MKSWDPFRDLLTIQDRMNKLFETVLTGPVSMDDQAEGLGTWRPVAEVVETAENYEIHCELAGLEREQVDVKLDGQVLLVQGERRRDEEVDAWTYHQLERPYGRFSRRFELPEGTDLDQIRAGLDDGVLHITLPKLPEAQTRAIELEVGTSRDH